MNTSTTKPRAFRVWLASKPEWSRIVIAETASAARYSYWLGLQDCADGIRLIDMRSRVSEPLADPDVEDRFVCMCKYRGIPFAKIGMRVIGEGCEGVIVGSNSSCNLDVLCDGVILNIHPSYDVRYFADDGSLVAHVKHGAKLAKERP